jgi:hypothetical protein
MSEAGKIFRPADDCPGGVHERISEAPVRTRAGHCPAVGRSGRAATTVNHRRIARELVPVTDSFDHVRREAMIPMRDGVKLYTVILVPAVQSTRACC